MKNPFKKDGYMLPIASVNSVYIDNTLASNLFRPSLLIEEIVKNKDELGIPIDIARNRILFAFNDLLNSDLESVKNKAWSIAQDFGKRLAKVLTTLFNPSKQSIINRTDWTKEHWDYWKSIQNIYLVGGLTSPILTTIFYDCIETSFLKNDLSHITVTFIEGSANLGTHGLASLVNNGDYLLFDFGQTNIKRARHYKRKNKVLIDTILTSIPSDYLFYKHKNDEELLHISNCLDNYIVDVIAKTYKQTGFKGEDIFISIANYVYEGKIYQARGGYGKLALIADNYQNHLIRKVSKRLNKDVNIKLFHDTTAMSLLFKDEPHTAVISLGTAFGIAFPE